MNEMISPVHHFLDGCVLEHDFIYMAAHLDDLEYEKYAHTLMIGFDAYSIGYGEVGNGWWGHDLNMDIVSLCVKKATNNSDRMICALSKEGEIELYSSKAGKGVTEKIPDAGLRLSEYKGGAVGYVTHIREIGGRLYVCGMSGQVYAREASGKWVHHDEGLFRPSAYDDDSDDDPVNLFNCIDGNDARDLYVVGDDGVAFHHDGYMWSKLDVPTTEHLQWVRCYGRDEVYLCGYNGVLLKGNARDGFKDVSTVEDNYTWWCLCKFQDKVYLSAVEGLFAWDGQKIAKVVTGLQPEVETWRVDADPAGKSLWSFGVKDLVRFDGQHWQRFHHPDNPRIGE
jgi:hypothetical protein